MVFKTKNQKTLNAQCESNCKLLELGLQTRSHILIEWIGWVLIKLAIDLVIGTTSMDGHGMHG